MPIKKWVYTDVSLFPPLGDTLSPLIDLDGTENCLIEPQAGGESNESSH